MHVGFLQLQQWGLLSSCGVQASIVIAPFGVEQDAGVCRLSSCNTGMELPHRIQGSWARDPGSVSPALADRVLTTGPLGQSQDYAFNMRLPIKQQ